MLRWPLLPFAILKSLIAHICISLGIPPAGGVLDDFAPHELSGFEGYYSRTLLDDGGTLAIIFCCIKNAKKRGNLVCVTYTPAVGQEAFGFTQEFYPEHFEVSPQDGNVDASTPFCATADVGAMTVGTDTVDYSIDGPNLQLSLNLTNLKAWADAHPLLGPMGPLAPLSPYLPLNWHVHTISSDATLSFTRDGHTHRAHGKSHFEKNWGTSFPTGWLWCQAFGREGRYLSFAGGEALPGVQAFLVGYRSAKYQWDFRPPSASGLLFLSPFMHVRHDSREGVVELEVRSLFRRLRVVVRAPPGSFVGLPAPMQEGHVQQFSFESFRAKVWTELSVRGKLWGEWSRVEEGYLGVTEEGVPCGALEFGGSYCHQTKQEHPE